MRGDEARLRVGACTPPSSFCRSSLTHTPSTRRHTYRARAGLLRQRAGGEAGRGGTHRSMWRPTAPPLSFTHLTTPREPVTPPAARNSVPAWFKHMYMRHARSFTVRGLSPSTHPYIGIGHSVHLTDRSAERDSLIGRFSKWRIAWLHPVRADRAIEGPPAVMVAELRS